MGESLQDRDDLLEAIASLEPESTPLNFYHPNPALPIKSRDLTQNEALGIISKARKLLGEERLLMVAGGRELLFSGDEGKMFEAGANAIVIGNYLTTSGQAPRKDLDILKKLGYEVATDCGTR
jgi:biotin synthase